jgi:type VI protein secretion system component VasF
MAEQQSDPDDSERTIIIPSPHGRQAGAARSAPAVQAPVESASAATQPTGINPLVAAANPLLDIVPQLRSTLQHPDPLALRDALARDIKVFEQRARAAGVEPEKIVGARYCLCTLLDEVAASTPWGGSGVWAKHTLLVMFHNETWGGEKFFLLLSRLAQDPGRSSRACGSASPPYCGNNRASTSGTFRRAGNLQRCSGRGSSASCRCGSPSRRAPPFCSAYISSSTIC